MSNHGKTGEALATYRSRRFKNRDERKNRTTRQQNRQKARNLIISLLWDEAIKFDQERTKIAQEIQANEENVLES